MGAAAKKLKAIRAERQFSRKKMASQLEITFSAYFKNENGESYPGWGTLYHLQEYFDISMDWFIFDRGPMYLKDKDNDAERIKELESDLLKCSSDKEQVVKELTDTTAQNDELNERLQTLREKTENEEPMFQYLEGVESELGEMVKAMNKDKRIRFKILSYFYECKDQISGEKEN